MFTEHFLLVLYNLTIQRLSLLPLQASVLVRSICLVRGQSLLGFIDL